MRPRPVEGQLELAVDAVQFVGRQLEFAQPLDEVRREHPLLAVEAVARQPDQLLLGEAHAARMIELRAQFALVDHVGEPHRRGAVNQPEGGVDVAVQMADHLQHQQFVEIGIEQAADDRVEPPIVIPGARRDVGNGHGRSASPDAATRQGFPTAGTPPRFV